MHDLIGNKKVFGISGWKNSGKTTLVTRVVSSLVEKGFAVSTLKHAHHAFDIDHEGTDSFRHREAGAGEVAIASARRIAIMTNNSEEHEPDFADLLQRMSPCDLVIMEGFKREDYPKLEIFGETPENRKGEPMWKSDDKVLAIASDREVEGCELPRFARDDIEAISGFIIDYWGLPKGKNEA